GSASRTASFVRNIITGRFCRRAASPVRKASRTRSASSRPVARLITTLPATRASSLIAGSGAKRDAQRRCGRPSSLEALRRGGGEEAVLGAGDPPHPDGNARIAEPPPELLCLVGERVEPGGDHQCRRQARQVVSPER